eukprot:COSAG02_NODE_709_length_18217_cov_13.019704_12_plen_100_part_00
MGMEVAVLLLGGFFALGAEGACDSVTCEEVCAPADATSGVDCTAGYVAGAYERSVASVPQELGTHLPYARNAAVLTDRRDVGPPVDHLPGGLHAEELGC